MEKFVRKQTLYDVIFCYQEIHTSNYINFNLKEKLIPSVYRPLVFPNFFVLGRQYNDHYTCKLSCKTCEQSHRLMDVNNWLVKKSW